MKKEEGKKEETKGKGKGKTETGKNTRKADDRYFWEVTYANTIPAIRAELDIIVGRAKQTDARMLRGHPMYQPGITKQTVQNLMTLYFADILEREKLPGLEKALLRVMPRLDELMAEELKRRDAIDKEEAESGGTTRPDKEAEGFTSPGSGEKPDPRARRPKR